MYHMLGTAVLIFCVYIYAQWRRRRLGCPPLKFASGGLPFAFLCLVIAAAFLFAGAP